jgi:hypothetical protein
MNDEIIDVDQQVYWLRSYLDPAYEKNMIFPPRFLNLYIGEFINEKVLLFSAPVTWKGPWSRDMYPYQATVSVEFHVYDEFPHERW